MFVQYLECSSGNLSSQAFFYEQRCSKSERERCVQIIWHFFISHILIFAIEVGKNPFVKNKNKKQIYLKDLS